MSNVTPIKDLIGDFAKDIRLNISSILTGTTPTDLTNNQILGVTLAVSFATGNTKLIETVQSSLTSELSQEEVHAAKSAAAIMAMNNVYYRSINQISDASFKKLPTGLRMQVIGRPGIDKVTFELYCLAISALNGCGHCLDSHSQVLQKANISNQDIQLAIKIASVIQAAHISITIEST